jgi:hypothetical protein
MGNDFISGDVEEFIRKRIDSVAQLEALLLVRSDPEAEWSVGMLAKRLYTSEVQAIESVEALYSDGLLIRRAGPPVLYQYQPGSNELRELVNRVAEAYAKHLVPITNLIHSKPKTRVQEFADAFRWRKEES